MKPVPLALGLVPLFSLSASAKPLDAESILDSNFGNDADWYRERIPLFESSDESISEVYYYRWKMFRTHQRNIGDYGYISTEFIDNVGWQTQPWASNNCAAIFHLNEGRWCRDARFRRDYATFMYSEDSNPRQYTEALADGVWNGFLVDGDESFPTTLLQQMQDNYEGWLRERWDDSKGLFWVEPLQDATEYTIASIDASGAKDGFGGGQAFRPTFNSYQVANARAIVNIAKLQGDSQDVIDRYEERAQFLKTRIQEDLWNSTLEHFIDRYYADNEFVKYWEPIRGRELAGIVPWTHNVPDDEENFAAAFQHILNSEELGGPFGLRTVEPSYEHYMRVWRYDQPTGEVECHWNGPSWPYQTTQVLTAVANVLNNNPVAAEGLSTSDYTRLLKQYADIHYNKVYDGKLDLEENYDPDTGEPIVGLDRSHHYFHSGYIDLIVSGLVGIRPRQDNVLEVNPLADPRSISYFRLENILYHGRNVSVQWDADGQRYGEAGLRVEIDGQLATSSDTLERLETPLEASDFAVDRSVVSRAIQLQPNSQQPVVRSSVENANQERVHDVFDGRIWFWPESGIANGFDTPEGNGDEQWVSISLAEGSTASSVRTEVAFFVDSGLGFDVPESYKLQTRDGDWADITDANYEDPVANGITVVTYPETSAREWRILVTPKAGSRVRVVETTIVAA